MPHVTIYLDESVFAQVKAATEKAGISQSQWIAEAVRLRIRKEWPETVRALAGSWPDFPTAEDIRSQQPSCKARERL